MAAGVEGGEPTCGTLEFLVFLGALVAGTGCSLCSKMLLDMKAVGLSGQVEPFQNPLFQTWGMFLGMCGSLPMHFAYEAYKRSRNKSGYAAIGSAPLIAPRLPTSTYFLLLIPALFDLVATAFCMFGLTHIDVSVYQMLRGGAIVFVAILKHFMLGDKLAAFMWVGVALNVLSICMVGATAGGGGADGKSPLVGVALILAGALVQSLQYAFEEKVMSSDVGAPPLLVIGMEGLWGTVLCTFVVYPVLMYLKIEDPYDTWVMFKGSSEIQGMFALYFVSIFLYNILAVLVTYMLNSVWHAILDNFRPITVWGTDLFIFYIVSRGGFGEAWAWPGSYVQLGALFVLLYGTAVYNGSAKLPGFRYAPDTQQQVLLSPGVVIRASPAMASGALLRSPLIHGTPRSRAAAPPTRQAAELPRFARHDSM
ncbi:hypothetical protein M885DRAFT_621184 [Pelagophyceae sp. CCMP2097]|nr:hypothetical protein M885DRAFT_621184 [Pelagophyceae sp. CCMP2097]